MRQRNVLHSASIAFVVRRKSIWEQSRQRQQCRWPGSARASAVRASLSARAGHTATGASADHQPIASKSLLIIAIHFTILLGTGSFEVRKLTYKMYVNFT